MKLVSRIATVANTALIAGVLMLSPTSPLAAQAANYPAMQLPRASTRDYTAAIAAGSGTVALFQWREGAGPGTHLGLDVGLADYKGSDDVTLFVGGSFAKELLRAAGDQPLDVLFAAGVGAGLGGGRNVFRIPVGVSVGHTFDLDEGMSITPFAHPRLSFDLCSECERGSRNDVSLAFDIGGDFRVNRQFAIRAAASFSGSDIFGDDSFAVGFNWTPSGLSSSRQRAR